MRIDTAKIENYETMSAEDKLKALEEYEFETPAPKENDEVTKLKAALSKANSDAAEWKRQYRQGLDEAKRAEEERKEEAEKVQNELRELRRDKSVSGYVAQYLALGYTQELALKAAEATADNDAATIMSCQQEYIGAKTKELEAAALNKQPSITPGAPPTAKAAEADAYNKMRKAWGLPPINLT